jgi:hypothetical protein
MGGFQFLLQQSIDLAKNEMGFHREQWHGNRGWEDVALSFSQFCGFWESSMFAGRLREKLVWVMATPFSRMMPRCWCRKVAFLKEFVLK